MADKAASKQVEKNSTVFVSRTIGKKPGDPEEAGDEEILSVHRFVTEPAEVGVTTALTMNLGNYESARVSVSLTMPCYVEEVDKTYEWAQRWVEQRLTEERNQIDAWRKKERKINPL